MVRTMEILDTSCPEGSKPDTSGSGLMAMWRLIYAVRLHATNTSCQQKCAPLFEPKRGHRIDASYSLCWNPNGEERNCAEKQRRNDESNRIPDFDAKEEAGQEASEPEGAADAEEDTEACKDHALTDDHVA